jgi:hypothetical protein
MHRRSSAGVVNGEIISVSSVIATSVDDLSIGDSADFQAKNAGL